MANPPFDDFLELDMFDHSNSGMLSFFFTNSDDLNVPSAATSAVPILDMNVDMALDPLGSLDIPATPIPTETSSADFSIVSLAADPGTALGNESTTQDERRDIQLLLAINQQLLLRQQETGQGDNQRSSEAGSVAMPCIDNDAMIAQLIKASPLSVAPQALMASSALATPAASPTRATLDSGLGQITTATTISATADAQSKSPFNFSLVPSTPCHCIANGFLTGLVTIRAFL